MSITLETAPEAPLRSLPSLDAHAHIDHRRPAAELGGTGAVLAMTQSLDEARDAVLRREPMIVWGAGCHPREILAQRGFDKACFRDLVLGSPIVGEIGLDTGSKVPVDMQLSCFRQALEVLSDLPRLVSIHSYQATGMILEELTRTPIVAPVMHWWTGSAAETSRAVDLGCYFSVHSQVARHTKFRTRVPPERILLESDHGYNDPPAAIPCRIEWVEHLMAQQLGTDIESVRRLAWRNLATILRETSTLEILPPGLREAAEKLQAPVSTS